MGGVGGVVFDELGEVVEPFGVGAEEIVVDSVITDDAVGEGVEEGEVALCFEREVLGRDLRGLGGAWVDDDDIGVPLITGQTLVENGVGDREIGAHEDHHVGFFEVGVSVGWGIEPEGLLISDDRGGHALARVPIAMLNPHSKFGEGSEEGHLFGRDLTSGEEGDGFFAVFVLNLFEAVREDAGGEVP